ncbi:MAG: cupin domain-containing protein [Acetobacteraceae bacterium]|nr:cupin domain-containing protein [Acetobacteraceae bacterium]
MQGKVVTANARATKIGATATFTGTVYQDEVLVGQAPSRMRATLVSFTPGARTAWHAHPVGQTLYVTAGVGRICFEGQDPIEIEPGDTVMIPPNARHWHGAAPNRLFTHLAMSEQSDTGAGTDWFEHVPDADYTKAARKA